MHTYAYKHSLRPFGAAVLTLMLCLGPVVARAAFISIGIVTWDVTTPGIIGEFDITNITGANSVALGDPTFPVTTPVNLGSLSLVVDFSDGTVTTFGSSYFTLAGDGLSFDGTSIPIVATNPLPTEANLTGTFSPLNLTLSGGSTATILPNFTATILPSASATLNDGDRAFIFATTAGGPAIPEPNAALVFGVGFVVVALGLSLRHPSKDYRRRWCFEGEFRGTPE